MASLGTRDCEGLQVMNFISTYFGGFSFETLQFFWKLLFSHPPPTPTSPPPPSPLGRDSRSVLWSSIFWARFIIMIIRLLGIFQSVHNVQESIVFMSLRQILRYLQWRESTSTLFSVWIGCFSSRWLGLSCRTVIQLSHVSNPVLFLNTIFIDTA